MIKLIILFTITFIIIALPLKFIYATNPDSLIIQVNEDLYKLGDISINTLTREISFPAEFNMDKGFIELILCGNKGKLHESILKTNIIPSYLQTALLLLNIKCINPINFDQEDKIPEPDSLLIFAQWSDSIDNIINVRIERLVYNIAKKKEMQKTPWIFIGSQFRGGYFVADDIQSIITTYHDPFTIIDNPLETKFDDTLYKVNNNLVPPIGTKAKIIIKALNK